MSNALYSVKRFYPQVTTITQAKTPIKVEVFPGDGKGNRKKHQSCALAAACTRELHLDGAIVSRKVAYLVKGDTATRYSLSHRVQAEIMSFDRGSGFAPGMYRLSKPEDYGKYNKSSTSRQNRKTGTNTGERSNRKLIPGLRKALYQ